MDHTSGVVVKVMVGASNATAASLAYKILGDTASFDSGFRGFAVALGVAHSFDYSVYVAVGAPNASSISIARSVGGTSWTGLDFSSTLCSVGVSVVYGRGRFVVGCADAYTLNFGKFPDGPELKVTSSPMLVSRDMGISFAPALNAATLFGFVSKIAYSDILLRFVAIGRDRTGTVPVIAHSFDGFTWTASLSGLPIGANPLDIVYGDNIGFVISSVSSSGAAMQSSTDGLVFSTTMVVGTRCTTVAYSPREGTFSSFANDHPNFLFYTSSGTFDFVSKDPAPAGGPIDSALNLRHLPLSDSLFLGGNARIANAKADATGWR